MKSVHFLIVISIMWISSAISAVMLDTPHIMFAPTVATFAIILTLGFNGKIKDE